MKAFESATIRNVAFVGHGGCGKTSLVACALHAMGTTPRLGRVGDGTAVTDFDAEEIGRHKKQTGGHGQFGDCKIMVRPLARGEDFRFVNGTFGGSIPKNFLPATEKAIQESRKGGVIAGCPMVDFEVEVTDGQYHDVDSSEMAFKIAGSLAFKDAVARCRPTLLEPMMLVEVRGAQKIRAEVPLSEMESFDQDLTSMTGGRGSFHMELIRYDEVPGHLQEKVAADVRAHQSGDHHKEEES